MRRIVFSGLALLATMSSAVAAPTINGNRGAGEGYVALTDDTAGRSARVGFGTSNDASIIFYTTDATYVYFFIRGRVSTTSSDDALMFILNTSAQSGAAAGSTVGAIAGAPHVPWSLTSTAQNQWKLGMEADHIWVAHTGTSTSNWFVRKASYIGTPTQAQAGQLTNQTGTNLTFGNGEIHAVVNDGGLDSGWEFAVPRTLLGNATNSHTVQAMAIILNRSNAFFSNDSAPQSVATPGNESANIGNTNGSLNNTAANVYVPLPTSATLPVTVSRFELE